MPYVLSEPVPNEDMRSTWMVFVMVWSPAAGLRVTMAGWLQVLTVP
jgi:hypothetical protein